MHSELPHKQPNTSHRFEGDNCTYRLLEGTLATPTATCVDIIDDLSAHAVGHLEPRIEAVLGTILKAFTIAILIPPNAGISNGTADILDVDLLRVVKVIAARRCRKVLHHIGCVPPPGRGWDSQGGEGEERRNRSGRHN